MIQMIIGQVWPYLQGAHHPALGRPQRSIVWPASSWGESCFLPGFAVIMAAGK